MLILGPHGENLELGSKDVTFRDQNSKTTKIPIDQILTSEIIDGSLIKISFVDLTEDVLTVKNLGQRAIDVSLLQRCHTEIRNAIGELKERPKHLLIFVNPGCGSFKGLSLYENEVDPIFALCAISTEVVVTQRFGQVRETLLTRDLSGVDGVLVVGGDGTFGDAAQGLLERAQIDAGIELWKEKPECDDAAAATSPENDVIDARVTNGKDGKDANVAVSTSSSTAEPKTTFFNLSQTSFVSNPIPIGHIPGGSGNGFATTVFGVHDAATSAILIALGRVIHTDVAAFARLDDRAASTMAEDPSPSEIRSTFWTFAVLMGVVTNLDVEAWTKFDNELRKILGPFRYFVYPFLLPNLEKLVLKVRYVESRSGGIPLAPAGDSVCRTGCRRCAIDGPGQTNPPDNDAERAVVWNETTIEEPRMVIIQLAPLRHRFSTFGLLPFAHLGDGLLHLVSQSHVSALRDMLHMSGLLDDDFVFWSPFHIISDEVVLTRGAPATAATTSTSGSDAAEPTTPLFAGMEETIRKMDGSVHVKVQRRLLRTYGTGLRNAEKQPRKAATSVTEYLARKTIAAIVIVGVVGVAIKYGRWRKWFDYGVDASAKTAKMSGEKWVLIVRALKRVN